MSSSKFESREIVELISLAKALSSQPFGLSVEGTYISCSHPMTNDGLCDEDYLVLVAEGFEECDIWIYQGEVDIEATLERLSLFNVSCARIAQLTEIFTRAVNGLS
jgi:hypothetical protein